MTGTWRGVAELAKLEHLPGKRKYCLTLPDLERWEKEIGV